MTKLYNVYASGTRNLIAGPIQAKSAKEAKLIAIALEGLNIALLVRLTAKEVKL
jgi:hypothetical protein